MRIPRTPSSAYASSSPCTSSSTPAGATRKRTHAASTALDGASGLWVHVAAERNRDRESVEVDAERHPAQLGVVPAADAGGELCEQRAVPAEQDLRRRRPELDPDRARGSGSGLDRSADLCRLERRGPEVCERNAECRRRSLLAVGDRERREAAAERERVDGHDAAADELLDEAELAAGLREGVGGRSGEGVAGRARA